eukprot:CAMPEP_0171204428 /NCGR_PEP_ID=MMETSP0790-20130122/26037_1 /TAXON_ID=2925 /ORGANISM="Alexandrium catenella, Strain OF101" /LENGTH=320 /DNA_ID=CAMNT_0011669931 /DNA_START=45 /DNA_END=1002 /DNA_ORIENTATION=-
MARVVLALGSLFTAGQQGRLPVKKAFGPERRRCRIQKSRPGHKDRVIGGTVVDDPTEFPFLAWLGDNDNTLMSQFCGGSLISDRVVLTAGHCLYEADQSNAFLLVRLQVADFGSRGGLVREVVNWRRDFEHSGTKTVVGWGSTDESCEEYDTLLRKTEVPFGTDGPSCSSPGSSELTADTDFDWRSQCCAGDYAGAMHYPGCGDSGGPLLARDGDWWSIVGMVSWSYGIPYPDVFTRVSYFEDWIKATMAELLEDGVHPAVVKHGMMVVRACCASGEGVRTHKGAHGSVARGSLGGRAGFVRALRLYALGGGSPCQRRGP